MSKKQVIKFSHEDSEYEGGESFQPVVFKVSQATMGEDLSLPPMSGEQYLLRAMKEAKQCPGVVVATVEQIPKQLPVVKDELVNTCNSDLLPNSWQISTMADFSKLRLKMDKLRQKVESGPKFKDVKRIIPEGLGKHEQHSLKIVLNPLCPTTRLCIGLSQVRLWKLLALIRDWLSDKDISISVGCRWVFCLLACIEQPIPPEVYFTLRQIVRILIDYRTKHIDNLESEELPHINLIICIIGRYFNQKDLADL